MYKNCCVLKLRKLRTPPYVQHPRISDDPTPQSPEATFFGGLKLEWFPYCACHLPPDEGTGGLEPSSQMQGGGQTLPPFIGTWGAQWLKAAQGSPHPSFQHMWPVALLALLPPCDAVNFPPGGGGAPAGGKPIAEACDPVLRGLSGWLAAHRAMPSNASLEVGGTVWDVFPDSVDSFSFFVAVGMNTSEVYAVQEGYGRFSLVQFPGFVAADQWVFTPLSPCG